MPSSFLRLSTFFAGAVALRQLSHVLHPHVISLPALIVPQAGISIWLVSSVALARTREVLHNGWNKNDPKADQENIVGLGQARRMAPPGHDACCTPRSGQSTERLANASEDEEEATDTAHLTGSADKVRDLRRAPRRLHRLPSSDTDDGPR